MARARRVIIQLADQPTDKPAAEGFDADAKAIADALEQTPLGTYRRLAEILNKRLREQTSGTPPTEIERAPA